MKIILNPNLILVKIILTILLVNGCHYANKPRGIDRGMIDGAPDGTPIFRSGWKDGCESGISAVGSLQYKAANGFSYDATMLSSNEYHNAWRLGFRYCRWYTAQWLR